jgi:3',5'-nucleoside bisphosphate phosphatase
VCERVDTQELGYAMGVRFVAADLHIHTCLSPCASLDMSPRALVKKATQRDLSMIAVTDHNSAENVAAVIAAARDFGIEVIPGMEVTTSEEVHLVALFETLSSVEDFQDLVYASLTPGTNDERVFGMQVIVNDVDEVEGFNDRLLIGATSLSVEDAVQAIHERDGLVVAAHIDRVSFGIIGQLGSIPEALALDAIEVSPRTPIQIVKEKYGAYQRYPFITASDAHTLEELGTRRVHFEATSRGVVGLREALTRADGGVVLSGDPGA